MRARDVMTPDVVTVAPDTTVEDIAALLLERHISAVPVLDAAGEIVGIVSEGDLLHRHETDTERHRSWWLALISLPQDLAHDYVKSHGRHARDVMTENVITVGEETPLGDIATVLEDRRIKRVPVVRDGKLVGIVSRANLLQALVARGVGEPAPSATDDRAIRKRIVEELAKETGARVDLVSVIVEDGTVHLWGLVDSADEKDAVRIAAENVAGVRAVENHTVTRSRMLPLEGV